MDVLITVLGIVAPVFLLASAGFAWRKLGYDYPTEFVTRLAMTLAVPALIFTSVAGLEVDPAALGQLTLATLLGYGAVATLTYGVIRLMGLDRRTFLAPLTFANTGNVGLPLALFAFGEAGLGLSVVVFAVMAMLMFSMGLWMVAGLSNPARVLREPIVFAALLGTLFLWQGWHLPEVAMNALGLLGQMAIPLMLLTLGAAVAVLKPDRILPAIGLSAVKLGISIGVAVAVGSLLALPPLVFGVLVLQMATPVGVTSYLLAERYKTEPDVVAGLVVVSTLLSVIALPITLSFLV